MDEDTLLQQALAMSMQVSHPGLSFHSAAPLRSQRHTQCRIIPISGPQY